MTFRHIHQTILHDPDNGKHGDCHRTALAMALGINAADIPNFGDPREHPDWRGSRNAWLAQQGLGAVELPFPASVELETLLRQLEHSCGEAVALLAGYSPRGTYHETVVHRGKMYDPHPSESGIVRAHEDGYWWVTLLCPLPGALRRRRDG